MVHVYVLSMVRYAQLQNSAKLSRAEGCVH
jgi:hypothetical protein